MLQRAFFCLQLLHKNGKIAILNGTSDGEETVEVIIQAEDINGFQEEEVAKEGMYVTCCNYFTVCLKEKYIPLLHNPFCNLM